MLNKDEDAVVKLKLLRKVDDEILKVIFKSFQLDLKMN